MSIHHHSLSDSLHRPRFQEVGLQLLGRRWEELRVPAKVFVPRFALLSKSIVRTVGEPFEVQDHRILKETAQENTSVRLVSTTYNVKGWEKVFAVPHRTPKSHLPKVTCKVATRSKDATRGSWPYY